MAQLDVAAATGTGLRPADVAHQAHVEEEDEEDAEDADGDAADQGGLRHHVL